MMRSGPWRLQERLWTQLDINGANGCWIWLGLKDRAGYGRITVADQGVRTHRLVYEQLVGSIPDGLVLDHLCRVHACSNPAHLEPVTIAENNRRGEPRQRTHCPRGHAYEGDNLRIVKWRTWTSRRCKACNTENARRYRERKREAQHVS